MKILAIALVPACIKTTLATVREMRTEYSHAAQMARFIRQAGYDLQPLPIAASTNAEAVLPYLRCRTLWSVNTARAISYNPWDARFQANWRIVLPGEVWNRFESQFPDPVHRPPILWEEDLPYADSHGYRLAYRTQGPVVADERFYLYVPK